MSRLLSEHEAPLAIHRKILGFAWVGWIFDFYDLNLLSFLIASTPIAKDLNLGPQQQAWALGSSLAFTAVGGLVFGALADRYGRRPMLMATILIYSAGTCASGLAVDMWTLLLARIITGLGVGGEWAVAHAMVGETVPPAVRGRYGSYLQTGATFGLLLSTAVGNYVAPIIGWRWTFILSALPALIVIVIRREMPESDLWLKHRGEKSEGHWTRVVEMLRPGLRKATFLAFSLTSAAMAGYWFKNIWLPSYYHKVRGFSLEDSATLLFLGQIGSLIGYVVFGYFSDRFGRRPSFSIFAGLKALCLALITLGWALTISHPAILLMVVFAMGFGEGNWGCIGPLLSEIFPTRLRASALGIIYNFSRGVQFLAPVIITAVATRYTFAEGIALGAFFAALSGGLVWLLPETKGLNLAIRPGDPVPATQAAESKG